MSTQALIRADLARFRVNQVELRHLLAGPTGPVGRDLARRAIRVEGAAKRNASHRPGPKVRTGRLRGSITWRLGIDGLGLYADIGTNVEYGPYLERGTSRMQAYPFLEPALSAGRI